MRTASRRRTDLPFGDSTLVFRLLLAMVLTIFSVYAPIPPEAAAWNPLVAIGVYVVFALLLSWQETARRELREGLRFLSYLVDIGVISFTIYSLRGLETNIFLAYFVVILLSIKGSNLRHNVMVGLVICFVYGWLMLQADPQLEVMDPDFLLRFPFLIIICAYTTLIAQRLGQTEESLRKANERLQAANARLEGQVSSRTRDLRQVLMELRLVNEMTHTSFRLKNLGDFWPVLSEKLKQFFGCERVSFFLQDNQGKLYSLYAEGMSEPIRLETDKGIVGEALRRGEVVYSNDPYGDPRFSGASDQVSGFKTRNLMAAPMVREGEVAGVVELVNRDGDFDKLDAMVLSRIAPQLQMVYDKLKGDLDRQTMQDALVKSEKMAAVGRLMAGLSHEIKNPLAGIIANVQLLLRGGAEKDELLEMLGDVEKAAKYCNEILNNLLVYSRDHIGPRVPHNLLEIAEKSLRLFGKRFELSNIDIRRSFADADPVILCNRVEIQQVVINLLANARDVMPSGGAVTLRLRQEPVHRIISEHLSSPCCGTEAALFMRGVAHRMAGTNRKLSGWAVLEVSDSGTGLSFSNRERLFEPFFTTKEPGSGVGLGLSVSQEIAEQHGGVLLAHNNKGSPGATFFLLLPSCLRR